MRKKKYSKIYENQNKIFSKLEKIENDIENAIKNNNKIKMQLIILNLLKKSFWNQKENILL